MSNYFDLFARRARTDLTETGLMNSCQTTGKLAVRFQAVNLPVGCYYRCQSVKTVHEIFTGVKRRGSDPVPSWKLYQNSVLLTSSSFSFSSVVFNFPTTTVGNHHLVSMQDGHLIPARQLSSPGWTPQSGAVSSTQVRRTLIGQLLRCLASSDWSLIKRSRIGQLLTCLASSDWSLVFWCCRHHIDS